MAESAIRFEDGGAYERSMGVWSRLAGEVFLDWLAPAPGLGWVDVGCGSGAFTALVAERCAPAEAEGIDPSAAQVAFARGRAAGPARFSTGDAMALPFADGRFDAAVMALVIFFVPEPARGVAEMARVVRPGGLVAAYAWDMLGGGFPYGPVQAALREMGIEPPLPPSVEASRAEALRALWEGAGLVGVAGREIRVSQRFDDVDAYLETARMSGSVSQPLSRLGPAEAARLREGVRARLSPLPGGGVGWEARANAIRGRVPG
ncbi:methyltransferase domain-containing protein [Roseomonas nepalensis]|uniref:Methyltransferase domain-containing protein n=1 Tax=Muricoccus nepalensis TaxID=1854500 RepID=A0A502FC36_9PROT|nr:class I SAM-dependent methyltransferase [Roseomonas nepalensis]TPG46932.1 methyltransferase domain-containing protein [Roseomonas nepalensis]